MNSGLHCVLALSVVLAAVQLQGADGATYGYGYGGSYGYGASHSVFLNRPQLILPPTPDLAPTDAVTPTPEMAATPVASAPAPPAVPEAPACSVYAKAYSTGDTTGHLSLLVSSTSNAAFEAPYTATFANPSISGVSAYNANNSPATVSVGDGGVVTAVVTSVIPAQNSNTLDFDLTSSNPSASYNPAGAYMPMWVSINGVACGIVTGF